MRPFLPALLAGLFGLWAGTFAGGTTFAGAAAGHLALLGAIAWVGFDWRDPLRLGRAGRLLPVALWVVVAASWWASPVPRAGRLGVLLLPAFLALPGVVERCWRDGPARRRGLPAPSLVVGAVALWSLADWLAGGAPRPAAPLGQHTLLAAWLVILLPLALLPARSPGRARWIALACGALAVLAVLASRSLLGIAALAAQALAAAWWPGAAVGRRARRLAVAAALVAAAALAPRSAGILSGADPSAIARATYAEAGLAGWRLRPFLGWGPGATPWTLAGILEPVPGVNPPGEAVGNLHSLPLQAAYELGTAGPLLAAAVVALFAIRRLAELRGAADPPLLAAGLLGLAGGAVTALGSAAVAVTALPLAAAVAAGAALAASAGRPRPEPIPGVVPRAAAAVALALLIRPDLAQWRYQRAIEVATPLETRRELLRAVELDPGFPLYRARLAAHRGLSLGERMASAQVALEAARDAVAVPQLWLLAGILGMETGQPWAPRALERACATAPLEPLAPFYLMLADPSSAGATRSGARALLAEPRLAAALSWESRPELFAQAVAAVERWEGVDPGWRAAFVAALPRPEERVGPITRLATGAETGEALVSLYLFRREPWAASLPGVPIRERLLDRLSLPPATALATTSRSAFTAGSCRPAGPAG